jgi:radical SAM additional 4Fe4S-binding domain
MVNLDIKGKSYTYLPYSQFIFEYNPEIENSQSIRTILSKERDLKKTLEDTMSKYIFREEIELQACQVNLIHNCNLSCKYCFAGDGTHNKVGTMKTETAKETIDFILGMMGSNDKLMLTIIGGEPFLNIDTFESMAEYAREKFLNSGKQIQFGATTNGTLFNDKVAGIIQEYNVAFMTSLDSSDKSVNDFLRPSINKAISTYDSVIDGFNRYCNRLNYDSFHVTVTPYNTNISDIASDIYQAGAVHLHFSEVISDESDMLFDSNSIEVLKNEYDRVADIILQRIRNEKKTNCYPLMRNIGRIHRRKPLKMRCGVLNKLLAIDARGNLFPCDMLMWDQYTLGSLDTGIDKDRSFSLKKVLLDDNKCRECWARYLCGGECLAEKLWENVEQKKLRCDLKKHICKLQIYIYDYLITNRLKFDADMYQF